MRVIDLSHEIYHEMKVFPADPPVGILTHHNYGNIGYHVSQVIIGTHSGTHVDVPLHRFPGGTPVDKAGIEKFFGNALIIDLTFLKRNEEITIQHLEEHQRDIEQSDIILFKTNWSKYFGTEEFFTDFNGISEDAAVWITSRKIKMIGLESPSVHPIKHQLIHDCFLKKEIIVLESLNNLNEIKGKYVQLFAVPLKLKDLDGSPVRAFAIEG